ncbi:MAG TPA: hypothetical protein P5561_02710 [Candidatus Omnitrophota bacterium]|nr:hypothetical protein [Candidatus Omnitrophota bacterium]HRY85425.1 hypothetical protein [Candidatus Omnitrophota bacterium]
MKKIVCLSLILLGIFFSANPFLYAEGDDSSVPDVGPSHYTGAWSDEEGNNYYE